jgi:transposase
VKWIQRANKEGTEAVLDRERVGRPPRINKEVMKTLAAVLANSPREVGVPRNRWDGNALVKYLKKTYHIEIHVRHAQRIMKSLAHSPKIPVVPIDHAAGEGAKIFGKLLNSVASA